MVPVIIIARALLDEVGFSVSAYVMTAKAGKLLARRGRYALSRHAGAARAILGAIVGQSAVARRKSVACGPGHR